MQAQNPFNPRIPARPEGFIGRDVELKEFLSCLYSTMQKSPMSIAVIGSRGIGKTSFLAKCEYLSKEKGCIVIRFSSIEGGFKSVEDLCEYLLLQLQNEIVKRSKLELLKKGAIEFFKNYNFKITYKDVGVEIRGRVKQSALQYMFRDKLLEIWENIENSCNGIIIMVDEAEIIEDITGALMFLREVFSRLGEGGCGYMILLSGKLAFPEQMSEKFSPLVRFFHPIALYNFSKEEGMLLLKTKLEKTGIRADKMVLEKMYEESEGHPYVLVAIAYLLYENLPEKTKRITLEIYNAIKPKITSYLNSDFFGIMYRRASPLGKLILKETIKLDGETTFNKLVKTLRRQKGSISSALKELIEQGSLIKIERGKYRIFHSLYKDYIADVD